MTLSLFDVLDPKPAALPPPPQPLPIREGALPSPPAAPTIGALQLRPYQRECVNSVLSEFRRGVKKTLCVLATGAGKGTLGVELVRQAEMRGHGVLWLAHREELLLDIKGRMSRVGIHGLLEKAGERAIGNYGIESKVVVGSVQTMQGKRLEQWPADAFQLIVADEAHHVISRQHRQVLARFPKARVVGLTATPDRLDRKNIGRIFESLAYEFNLKQCIEGGYLVPLVAERLALDPPLDLRNLRTTAGDFNTGDLEAEVQANIGRLANALADTQILGNRKTIAFTPDIESAMSLAEAANDVGIPAEAISYK
ncbi:MAG TPA: DEAD/DEAH box helicase family protein, partial [Chloroflexota bacterium]|nr:DEAD/DEAH box helicase family protein [Chloroflexota bacterium]